jgi:HEAT repeat protein
MTAWATCGENRNVKVQIALALCKLKVHAADLLVFLTTTLATSPDPAIRKLAAEALACCGRNETDVVPALLTAALGDKDENVRKVAEAGLTQLRLSHEKAVQLCARQLKDSGRAESALRHSGQEAVPALVAALEVNDGTIRERAARTLGSLGEQAAAAVPALRAILRDKNTNVRLAAAKALWNVTKDADLVVPILTSLLQENGNGKHEAEEARRQHLQTIIEALCRIGPPAHRAVPALTAKAKDKNRLVRESALSALKRIAPPVAEKVLARL